ncbi:lytic transglycosylase domain-containing protein [Paludibaculum fermentans]|uniref:lytic transglycosylase domain-containing protein n=1 Tax=Paludibaculum fermentans TaxID=1473598 RepID=UPI003EB8FD4D
MSRYNQYNKLMAFCFTLALAATAAAAEPASRVVTTVRPDARTGRLVRSTTVVSHPTASKEVTPKTIRTAAASADINVGEIVERAAKAHAVDPLLVHSVIRAESNYNPTAVSPKGAEGLMQLIPATARRFGALNSFDAEENITAGVKYLKYLQEMFKDDRLALAAYNAGEGAVQKYGNNVPPYRETVQYVDRVGKSYGEARKRLQPETAAAVAPIPQQPQPEPFRHLEVSTDSEGRMVLKTR